VYSLATSLGWDVGRAVTTAVGVVILGRPVLAALRRTAARAAFVPATPAPAPRDGGPVAVAVAVADTAPGVATRRATP